MLHELVPLAEMHGYLYFEWKKELNFIRVHNVKFIFLFHLFTGFSFL